MSRLKSTSRGAEKIRQSSTLRQLIDHFYECDDPITVLDEGRLVGKDHHGQVYALGDVALKVAIGPKGLRLKRQNLLDQYRFMGTLSTYLRFHGSSVIAPESYFIARNSAGYVMLGSEFMDGWQSPLKWAEENKASSRKWDILANIMHRVSSEIPPVLRLGIDDIGNGGVNVLVPIDTDDPVQTPVCIIDQPASTISGYAYGRLATKLFPMETVIPVAALQ